MKLAALFMGVVGCASTGVGLAHAQDVDANQVVANAAATWVNQVGRQWAGRDWVDVSVEFKPSLTFAGSQVTYGQPTLKPATPTGVESLLAVNCGGPGSQPQVVIMQFSHTVKKTATTTVTQGVTASEAITLQASVPSWGVGVSETSTVSYTTTTSSAASTSVSYTYAYQNQVTLDPGYKQSATLMVNFQDTDVPWTANVVYSGSDTIGGSVIYWMNLQVERNGPAAWNYFTSVYPSTPLSSVLSPAQQAVQASGTFTGVTGSQGQAVNGPTEALTAKDRAMYCGSDVVAQATTRVIRIPTQPMNR
jgi:hypothetical protein